ncbi:1,2-phenylacetyl-CoA epoxidase subunit PaaC [Bacillus spongiae]|uniref:1,2-phenylacetyl-CoA epoxidase subunit PaaC n=1 Tax=Bacillus spongiae TaxID=2683610 RepID=A0ABU8HI93_9BACI
MGRGSEKIMITEHKKNKVLTELLYQLADDDFIHAYRGSEWLGLAPHIEEDVAFSSINQDTMGHATMLYGLLEELGEGNVDELAHERESATRRNAVLLELVNGPGHYMEEPRYDWAFTVVRNYFYVTWKKVKMESLKQSSYQPLADVAVKVNMELYYHVMHWKTWIIQLFNATDESRNRMMEALRRVCEEFADVISLGEYGPGMVDLELIESKEELLKKWTSFVKPVFQTINLPVPTDFTAKSGNGRSGHHTTELNEALNTLSEVFRFDRTASW